MNDTVDSLVYILREIIKCDLCFCAPSIDYDCPICEAERILEKLREERKIPS